MRYPDADIIHRVLDNYNLNIDRQKSYPSLWEWERLNIHYRPSH